MEIVINYDDKIYDTDTRNRSFVDVSILLEKLGIKNNKFMLALYDQQLRGIDPYAPDLSTEDKQRIITECKKNPWYFLREIVKFPAQGGGTDQYKADRSNMAQAWNIVNDIDTWSCKPRQNRATMFTIAIISWKVLFKQNESRINLNNRDMYDGLNTLKRYSDLIELLPEYMYDIKCHNKENIKHSISNNTVNITTLHNINTNEKKFKKFIDEKMCDEVNYFDNAAFIPVIEKIIKSSVEKLEYSNGQLRIFTSVRNKHSSFEMKLIGSSLMWNEGMYDIPVELIKGMINQTHYKLMYIEYGIESLELSEEWSKKQIRLLDGDERIYTSEVFLEFCDIIGYRLPDKIIPKE